jgi:hypothetical protein
LLGAKENVAVVAGTCPASDKAIKDGKALLTCIGFNGAGDHFVSKRKSSSEIEDVNAFIDPATGEIRIWTAVKPIALQKRWICITTAVYVLINLCP